MALTLPPPDATPAQLHAWTTRHGQHEAPSDGLVAIQFWTTPSSTPGGGFVINEPRAMASGVAFAPSTQVDREHNDARLLEPREQAVEVLAALGLNKSQLAEILHVTRPTLYSWLEGSEPSGPRAERLQQLAKLIAQASVSGRSPLNARFVRQELSTGTSLLDRLRSDPFDVDRVRDALTEVRLLTERAASAREEREATRRARGYREPTSDERRETLARNVAQLDASQPRR